jgi:hypothetical protein
MEAWKTASTVPTTFDRSPPELLDSDGKPQRTVKIGDMIEVPDMDGATAHATVEEISSWRHDKAMLTVGANGRVSAIDAIGAQSKLRVLRDSSQSVACNSSAEGGASSLWINPSNLQNKSQTL